MPSPKMKDDDGQLVVVANRLPLRRVVERHEEHWEPSPGGLVSALAPVMGDRRCTWVGWTGDAGTDVDPFEREGICFVPVRIDEAEVESYYEGFSNGTLWPLYHDAIRPPEFRQEWWEAYSAINQRFAERTADCAPEGGQVWVHDYQLHLVPRLLRQLRPDLRIGFFLHISFPPQELFMQLPWRTQIVEGMLGADVVGFQVPVAARNFAVLAKRLTSARGRTRLDYEGRQITVGSYPVSIDVERYAQIAGRQETKIRAKQIREQLGNPRTIFLGVDRLDYTKGIEARLKVYKEMLVDGTIVTPESVMVQIAVPTRDKVPAYIEQRESIERLVGEINGTFAQMGAPAVHYLNQNLALDELVALYCAADILLVTPYRDGMNLVVKEYVAARSDTGAVVLSEFAGAAQSMRSAYLVNPHHTQQVKQAMLTAFVASPAEQRRRMRALRNSVLRWTDADWANAFLATLDGVVASDAAETPLRR